MKRTIALVTILFCMITLALAQAAAPAPPAKIGFVSYNDVVVGVEEGKVAADKLNKMIGEKQNQYNAQRGELDRLKAEFDQKQMSLNPATRQEMASQLEEKQKALTRFEEDAQGEINNQRGVLFNPIFEKAQKIINDYAAQNGFAAVFMRDPQIETFIAPALDLTAEVIKIYNTQNPVAAAPAPAATAPAAPKP
jgi:outer membrane protein